MGRVLISQLTGTCECEVTRPMSGAWPLRLDTERNKV
jgi:hypothetical protein